MSWIRYVQSYTGRAVLQWSAVAASMTTFSCYFLPSTFYIDKYKEFVQSYEKGMEQPVPAVVTKLYDQVLKDMEMEQSKSVIQVFSVYGFDLFNAGSTAFKTGAIIGVPVNFSYNSVNDVNRNIKLVDKTIDWSTADGQKLSESLVLSEQARMFGLAREVCAVKMASVWLYGGYPSLAIILTYMSARSINDKLNLRTHPFRFIMYALVATFMFTLSMTLTDLTTAYRERSLDEDVARLSPAYAEGGLEFYTKLMQRNQALRELMGDNGRKLYTVSGNDNVMLRMKHTPLTERLRDIQAIINEKKQESAAESDAS